MQRLVAARIDLHRGQRSGTTDLAHRHHPGIGVHQSPQALQEGQRLGLVHRVGVVLHQHRAVAALLGRRRRVVAQLRVVRVQVGRVQAEAVHTAVQPEACDAQHRFLHRRAVKVQVRHLRQEVVQVVLPSARLPAPGRATHPAQPVVGRCAVLARIGPHVPVGLGVVAAASALLEPGVLGRGVAPNLVDHHLQAQPLSLGHQCVEVGQCAEARVHAAMVGHVVAEVAHRAREKGRDPDAVDAQRCDVGQPARDAGQVAQTVAVGVGEAARVDLIQRRTTPPVVAHALQRARPMSHKGAGVWLKTVSLSRRTPGFSLSMGQ